MLSLAESNKKGPIIFGAAVVILLLICLIAYAITGDQGIEERFQQALGQIGEHEGGGGGFLGFSVEGNLLAYLVVLALLLVICAVVYLKYWKKPSRPGK